MGHHQLVVNRTNPLVLITDSTEHVHVRASVTPRGNYLVGADIDGSPQSVEVAELYDVIMPITARLKDVERQGRSVDVTKRQEAKTLAAAMADSINEASLAFAEAHAGTLAALNALEGLDPKNTRSFSKPPCPSWKERTQRIRSTAKSKVNTTEPTRHGPST